MEKRYRQSILNIFLVLLIAGGIFLRFYNLEWDSGALLHPDEYGLTNTLTRLSLPRSFSEYFNTRLSPISPYDQYDIDGSKISDGPDNRMRWGQLPIMIIRSVAEALNRTGYLEMRLTGRVLSALADVGTMLILFLVARLLLKQVTADLLATAFYGYAVMAIQQAHFMTVDHFAVFFIMLTILAAVKISQADLFQRDDAGVLQPGPNGVKWFLLFGVFLGLAVACKINQAVLGIVLPLAFFIAIADFRIASRNAFWRVFFMGLGLCILSAVVALVTFRIFQPMSFRAATGDTGIFTIHFNKDWVDSMLVSMSESSGIGGGPPSEQWARRTPLLFPLINMVLYGMGLPLGIAVWIAALAALWKCVRSDRQQWKILAIPLFWSLFYFLFMGTRFVKSIRYLLPIYPMLCLLLAWALTALMSSSVQFRRNIGRILTVVILFTGAIWPVLFASTVYGQPHSRVEAVNWIYDEIPSAIQLEGIADASGSVTRIRLTPPEPLVIGPDVPFEISFRTADNVLLQRLIIPHVVAINAGELVKLRLAIESDLAEPLATLVYEAKETGDQTADLIFPEPAVLLPNVEYRLRISNLSAGGVRIRRNVIANESWDEGLPFPLNGLDPFGQLYTGMTNEVRWADNENKKAMLLNVLDTADYLILPSQRSIWSAVRIPRTYPMTIAYYHALFDGSLGFELAAGFQRPFKIGDMYFSDLTGTVSWGAPAVLPVKNLSIWGAEEAFSVYDHPPVWIFRKTENFSLESARSILDSVNLDEVVVQGPRDAEWPEGYKEQDSIDPF
ncbi:MAG: glycosyltransferase family 39 protein [Chloroflexi bacterium]|nr:glycosyltransferase family 39 protein [Chloroflexota bacterium]